MKDTKGQNSKRRPAGGSSEMRIVGIDWNPAPDAEERLRRLFTILVKLAGDDLPLPGIHPSPDDGREERKQR